MSPNNRQERVLIFAPYALWNVHSFPEIAVFHNLKHRDANPLFIVCDGVFKDCDLYWKAICGDRTPKACLNCSTCVGQMLQQTKVEYQWISRYLTSRDLSDAATYAAELSPDTVSGALFDGVPLFDWIRSSIHTHFRVNRIDFSRPSHFHVVRNYLEGGALTLRAVRRILQIEKPTRAFLFNGRVAYARVALELFRKANIPTVCHERGLIKESVCFWEGENCTSLLPFRQIGDRWNGEPLSPEEVRASVGWLQDRRFGKNMNWNVYSRAGGLRWVRRFLEGHQGKRIVTLFTSSTDEVVAEPDYISVFGSQETWIKSTVDLVARRDDCVLIIRVHPNSGSRVSHGRNTDELAFFEEFRKHLPANVAIVLPDDPVSSYVLMDICHVGLVYASTVAIELACMGKPVYVACTSAGAYCRSVLRADDAAAYPAILDRLITHVQTREERLEILRLGLRFARGYQRWNVDFPIVHLPNFYRGELAVPLESLGPGNHPCLDHSVEIILGQRDAVPRPDPQPTGATDREREAVQEYLFDEEACRAAYMVPKVSIVMVACDQSNLLAESVYSIINQSYEEWELILVGNGGTDALTEVAKALISLNARERIRLLTLPGVTEPARARNDAFRLARGDYFLVVDPGDTLTPCALGECVAVLDGNPSVDIACPSRLRMLEAGVIRVENPPPFTVEALRETDGIGHDALYRRRVWRDNDGYRDNVGILVDWDFWLAAVGRGFQGSQIQKPLFIHRGSVEVAQDDQLKAGEYGLAQLIVNNPGCFLPDVKEQAVQALERRRLLATFTAAEKSGEIKSWAVERIAEAVFTAVELNDLGLCMRACRQLLKLDPGNERASEILRQCEKRTGDIGLRLKEPGDSTARDVQPREPALAAATT